MAYSTRDTYYKNEIQIRTGLNGCYNPVRTIYVNTGFWQMTECATDLMSMSGSTQYNANCDVSPSRPGVSSTVWSNGYSGVMRCNEIIDLISASKFFTDEQKLPWIAEAVVMRAFYYYILTSTFGDVPFYTEAVTEGNRADIAKLPRMSAKETRDYLIDELMSYLMPVSEGGLQALPMTRTYENPDKAYAGAALGFMVAGKLCMWNERYDDAIKVFGQLENIYGNYRGERMFDFKGDYPLSDVRWSEKFVKESILEIGNKVEEFGLVIKGGLAQFCMPTRTSFASSGDNEDENEAGEAEVSNIYSGVVIPELGGYAKTNTSALPTQYYYTRVLSYYSDDLRNGEYSNGRGESNSVRSSGNLAWRWLGTGCVDKKKDENGVDQKYINNAKKVYWFNKPSGTKPNDSVSKPHGNNQPWLGNKFWCFGMHNTQDGNNYKIFRYAGVLLNLAEAHLVGKGDMQTACEYLNIIRNRAGLGNMTPASVNNSSEALMEEIRMECARELFGEFQRKFDLVRWGIWYERTTMYNEGLYIKDFIQPCHEYWPIPAEQVTYSGGALDNNAYKE